MARKADYDFMWGKLDEYWNVLQRSALAEKSVEDYYYFAECFVRWTAGEFVPGGQVRESE